VSVRKDGGPRAALVTGAAGGVGRAVCELLSEHQWRVYAFDRQPCPEDWSPSIRYDRVDVTDRAGINEAVARILAESPALHAVVNNAALQVVGPTLDQDGRTWAQVLQTNIESVAIVTKAALQGLEAAGGSVVNVASVHAVATSSDIGVYAASKGGLVALTRALAIELAGSGIRVNAVLPGAVDTSMLRAGLGRASDDVAAALRSLGERTVMGRVGHPREIASVVRFLADCDMSSYMTGAGVVVDGGATIRLSTE